MLAELQIKTAPNLVTWQDAFEAWLRLDGRKGSMKPLREKSVLATLQDVRHFSRFLGQYEPGTQACSPAPQAVKAYFEWQTANSAAPASINRRLASLRTLMRWSLSAGMIDQDPTTRIPRIETSRLPPRAKDGKECKQLAKTVRTGKHLRCGTEHHRTLGLRDQVIWELMYNAGLRREEVAMLSLEGLDLAHNRMIITGKGGKVGEVHARASLRKVIERWIKSMPAPIRDGYGTPLVVSWSGERVTAGQVARRFDLICGAAGVDGTCHDMRHTFVYRIVESAIENGATRAAALMIACQEARHGDTRITETYLRPNLAQVQAAMEGMR